MWGASMVVFNTSSLLPQIYICIHTFIHIYVYICVCVNMLFMYIYIYFHIYIYVYIYTFIGMWGASMVVFNTSSLLPQPGRFFLIGGDYVGAGPMSRYI
jgi:hypothetical protein